MRAGAANALLEELRSSLAAGALIVDRDLLAGYATDLTGRFSGSPLALARPSTVPDVERTVAACVRHGVPLVPQGGNTGLVGGGVPRDGELVLSLQALDELGDVDLDAYQVEVGGGATLEVVQRHVAAAGLELPIDHAARGTATIGGMVATNAGGPLAVRHGSMRARVVGLEAVLPGVGVVRRTTGVLKDNAGYDLTGLLVGSEGTLGVVTAARLQLVPSPRVRLAALFGLADLSRALDLLRALRRVEGLEALDFLDARCMELVREHRKLRAPLAQEHERYLIAQFAADADMTDHLGQAVDAIPDVTDVVAASDTAGRRGLWAYREGLNEAIRSTGIPHKLDVGLPIAALPEFDRRVREVLAAHDPGWRVYLYGHLGDGNVHVNVVGPDPEDDAAAELTLRCATTLGGTISAEHGVGQAKRRWLHLCRSAADIEAMLALKRALDPASVLAPGRVLPDRPGES